MSRPDAAALHDSSTGSVQYVASAPAECCCVIVDPVLDFDEKSGAIANCNADRLLDPILKLSKGLGQIHHFRVVTPT